MLDVGIALHRFEKLATSVDLGGPWATPNANQLDGQTFQSWILATCRTRRGREFFRICCEAVFATEAANLSLLHALFYSHSGGGLEHLIAPRAAPSTPASTVGCSSCPRTWPQVWATGSGSASRSPPSPSTAPESGSRRNAARTMPRASSWLSRQPWPAVCGSTRSCRAPGCAHPAHAAGCLVVKCQAVYDRPFWRDAGLSGEAVGDTSPVKVVFDGTPPGEGSPGVLVAFIEAADAIRLSAATPDEHQAEVLDVLAHYVGDDARRPVAFVERDWSALAARLLRRAPAARSVDPGRCGTARAGRADPLGRHRDRGALVWLHRRRDHVR